MKQFISCDWGTSAFRLRLVGALTKKILAETRSAHGIAATNDLWKQQIAKDRVAFYKDFILKQIQLLEKEAGYSLYDVPVVISGMASSTIGMMELPYKSVPIKIHPLALEIHLISATQNFQHRIILVSGIRSSNDVMRGEETILAGCPFQNTTGKHLFIFPGTHSKHIILEKDTIVDFKTYMTGELFELLYSKSILATSIEKVDTANMHEPFLKGIQDAMSMNLLNSIFHVRTNTLFNTLSKKDNYIYLSGLMIGEELKNLQNQNFKTITIVSTGILLELYTVALANTGFQDRLILKNADEALINGQALIFNQYQ